VKLNNKNIIALSILVLILCFGAVKFNSMGIESITGAITVSREWTGYFSTGDIICTAEGRRCITAYDTTGYKRACNYKVSTGSADCLDEIYGTGVKWPNVKSTGNKECLTTQKPCLITYEATGIKTACSVLVFGSSPSYNYFGAVALCADNSLPAGENCLENIQCLNNKCVNYRCSECTFDYNCQTKPWLNYCVNGQCIECKSDSECDVGTCQSGFCDECNTNSDCEPPGEFCFDSRRCVECLTNADCDDGIRLTSDYCNEIKVCQNIKAVDCLDNTDCPDYYRLMCVGNELYNIFMDGSCLGGICDYVDNTESVTPCGEGEICYNKECIPEDQEPEPECYENEDCDSGYTCDGGVCVSGEEEEEYDFTIGDTGVYCATSTCEDFSSSSDACLLYGAGCGLECVYDGQSCYLSGGLIETYTSIFDCESYGKCKDGWKTRPPCVCAGDLDACANADEFYTKEHKVQCTNIEEFPVFDNFNLLVSMILLTMYYLIRKRFRHVRSIFFVS